MGVATTPLVRRGLRTPVLDAAGKMEDPGKASLDWKPTKCTYGTRTGNLTQTPRKIRYTSCFSYRYLLGKDKFAMMSLFLEYIFSSILLAPFLTTNRIVWPVKATGKIIMLRSPILVQ